MANIGREVGVFYAEPAPVQVERGPAELREMEAPAPEHVEAQTAQPAEYVPGERVRGLDGAEREVLASGRA